DRYPPVASVAEQSLMCSAVPRNWLPIALALTIATSIPATPARPNRAIAFPLPLRIRRLAQCPDGRGIAHPSDPLEKLALEDRYLDAVLLASSLSKSVAKTCFALPTCGTALVLVDIAGLS